jgi:hypothetical protein
VIGQADKLLVVVLYHRPILSSDKEQRFLVRYRLKWQYLAFRFEQPRDNSWVVGKPEVIDQVPINALIGKVKYWEELVRFPDYTAKWTTGSQIQ